MKGKNIPDFHSGIAKGEFSPDLLDGTCTPGYSQELPVLTVTEIAEKKAHEITPVTHRKIPWAFLFGSFLFNGWQKFVSSVYITTVASFE